MDVDDLMDELSLLEKRVLLAFGDVSSAAPEELLKRGRFAELVEVMNASSWLQSKGLVTITEKVISYYSLAKKQWATKSLPERRALKALRKARGRTDLGTLQERARLSPKEVRIAIGWMKRKAWATIEKEDGGTVLIITEHGKRAVTEKGRDEELIQRLSEGELSESDVDAATIGMLLRRQDVVRERERVLREISLTDLGKECIQKGIKMGEEVAQLTPELLQTGKWKEVSFRKYDIDAFAPPVSGGRKHPLVEHIRKVKRIFAEMGFEEIEGDFVELSFWDFDALFQPQDHPARDMQDTFYLSEPRTLPLPPEELVQRIKEMHESGGDTASEGWKYDWDVDEARKAILRTHTTVNTLRYLSEHPDPPIKVFSVGRVFRREAMDSKHLPEFIQVEGIVMEEGANLAMLIGVLKEFYRKMGYDKINIRPGYFPYTEPSLEVEMYLNGEWVELGGAGILRPEVTRPFGVKHPVLAWGLGLERLVMALTSTADMRTIYVSDIEWLKKAKPIF
ncbi:MAG: phenylalanine--tRNA ligase subunit alpha [Thermoplasmata archaeon]|nr:phenylalanine--tRNA ligase subunit alpha [Thermoplasmata archaeon]